MIEELIRQIRELWAIVDRLKTLESLISVTGTWTPAYGGSTGAGTFTYTNQFGRYLRLENLCYFWGRCTISAITVAPTGDMRITGLPFTCVNVGNDFGWISFPYANQFNNAAAAITLSGYVPPNQSFIALVESFDNSTAIEVPAANFTNAACDLGFAGFYQVSGS